MQSILRAKLEELQKEKENLDKSAVTTSSSPKKLSLSILDFDFSADFANKSWVDIIDEEQQRLDQATAVKVEIVSSEQTSQTSPNSKLLPKPKEEWSEPNKGWCWDEKTLARREKELRKMKEKPTYQRYLKDVPKITRQKENPKTPNKYLAWSRRSWDQQVKLWKRAIYEWAGETPTSSVASSYCPSECSDEDDRASSRASTTNSDGPSAPKRVKLEQEDVNIPSNPDAMASLLGHFDLETLREAPTLMNAGDESTLKAMPVKKEPLSGLSTRPKSYAAIVAEKIAKGPTDFSHLISSTTNEKRNVEVKMEIIGKEVDNTKGTLLTSGKRKMPRHESDKRKVPRKK